MDGTINFLKIEYSINNGVNWSDVIASTPDDGSYSWTIPIDPSDSYLIKVSDIDGFPVDSSDAVFTVATPKVEKIPAY